MEVERVYKEDIEFWASVRPHVLIDKEIYLDGYKYIIRDISLNGRYFLLEMRTNVQVWCDISSTLDGVDDIRIDISSLDDVHVGAPVSEYSCQNMITIEKVRLDARGKEPYNIYNK